MSAILWRPFLFFGGHLRNHDHYGSIIHGAIKENVREYRSLVQSFDTEKAL